MKKSIERIGEKRQEVRKLRSEGLSIVKIAEVVGISKSCVSVWAKDIIITEDQKNKLARRLYEKISACKNCGNNFSKTRKNRSNKFCSKKCFGLYVGKINRLRKKSVKRECLICKKNTNGPMNRFCSTKCNLEYNWKVKIEKVNKSGFVPRSQSTAKKIVLKIRGHKCEVCGGIKWADAPIPLVLDHINGHSDDWRLVNLRLVCGNCDMMLPTYKSKNKGNGRLYDREYKRKIVKLKKEACDNGSRSDSKSDGPFGFEGSSPSASSNR